MNPSQPGRPVAPMGADDGGRWDAYITGYELGIHDGILIGRAQVHAEEWPVWKQFADHIREIAKRPGPITHAEREDWIRQQQREHPHAFWTPAQILAHARWSWRSAA
jgi:hypothetical protein